jgi:hypothetical protein
VVTYLQFRLTLDRRRWWLTLPLEIGGIVTLHLVIDTGSPLTGISERARNLLLRTPYLRRMGARRYALTALRIQGQAIPDLQVGLSRRATEVGVDGVLGLTFFGQFEDVHVHVPTLQLTLSR